MNSRNSKIHPHLKRRLIQEFAIVRERFGDSFKLQRRLAQSDNCSDLRLEGECPIEGQKVLVRICYPNLYPLAPPDVWLQLDVDLGCPHLLDREGLWIKICWIDWQSRQISSWPVGSESTYRNYSDLGFTALDGCHAGVAARGTWPVADAWE